MKQYFERWYCKHQRCFVNNGAAYYSLIPLRKIANKLAAMGRLGREGKKFHDSTLQKILANTIYIGIMRCGETRSPIKPELVIVERSVFDRAQKVKAQNMAPYNQRREIPAKTGGRNQLSGNTYCGHCGGKIFNSTRTDGHYHAGCGRRPRYKRRVYKCYNRTQHKGVCDGQTTHAAETVDKAINKILLKLFANTKALRQEDVIQHEFKKALSEITRKKKEAEKLPVSKQKERKTLDAHITDALAGKGRIGAEHLQRLLNDVEQAVVTSTDMD